MRLVFSFSNFVFKVSLSVMMRRYLSAVYDALFASFRVE